MKPVVIVFAALLAIILGVIVLSGSDDNGSPGTAPKPATTTTPAKRARTPPPPKLTSEEINKQDRVSEAQKLKEAAALDERPLLTHLPATEDGTTVSIGGLSADGKYTVLTLQSDLGEDAARAVYRKLLKRYSDTGKAYAVQYLP